VFPQKIVPPLSLLYLEAHHVVKFLEATLLSSKVMLHFKPFSTQL